MGTQLGCLKTWYIKVSYYKTVFHNTVSKIKSVFFFLIELIVIEQQ